MDPDSPTPDLDPYFTLGSVAKDGAKWTPVGGKDGRLDLLSTEAMFHVAGTIGMVLGAAVFVIFAVPVSGMLREGVEPGGVLLIEDWMWQRWVARMASVFTISVLGTVTSWGLSRLRPWARWALVALGTIPPLAMLVGLAILIREADPATRDLGHVVILPCVGMFVLAASVTALRAACSRRARAVFDPYYRAGMDRPPKLPQMRRKGLSTGSWLAAAMFILYWTLMIMFLGVLVACGVIRST